MLRDQFINFLESAVVVLALTNAVSVLAASYAIALMRGSPRRRGQPAEQSVVVQFPTGRARR
jgi:hypothetical protein